MPPRTTPVVDPTPTGFTTVPDDALAAALESDVTPPQELSFEPAVEEAPTPVDYTPDVAALQAAHGSPMVWAHELSQLFGSITGKYLDEETIADWLTTYASQVTQVANRNALFQVANTSLPAHAVGDPALLMLQLRDDIAGGFRHAAGMR